MPRSLQTDAPLPAFHADMKHPDLTPVLSVLRGALRHGTSIVAVVAAVTLPAVASAQPWGPAWGPHYHRHYMRRRYPPPPPPHV
ncbi:hypothetical protein, partial [Komagataeibacter sp. FXV3]|uniref:hypothetical protein n=1 Tax=Komagataeibacter sp. FXV3 TaxID=2608998 RepID=UPI00187BC342